MIVIVPSRGRPHNIAEMIEAWRASSAECAVLWVCVDDDDPTLDEYRSIELPEWAQVFVGPRLRLGGTLNHAAQYAAAGLWMSGLIGFMGDDHRPRSEMWDITISNMVRQPLSVLYGNDLVQGENLPTAVFLDARIIRTLGYMVPPGMVHLYLDDFWKLLGQRLGTLTYLPDVVIEHCHPTAGKAEWDEGYGEVNSAEMYRHDWEAFEHYKETQFEADLAKLQALR